MGPWKTPRLYDTAIRCTFAAWRVWRWCLVLTSWEEKLCRHQLCLKTRASRKYKSPQMQISCLDRSRFKLQRRPGLRFPLLQCLRLSRFTLESPAKVNPPRSPTDAHRTWKIASLLVGLIRCLISLSPTGNGSTTGILFQPASPQADLAMSLRTQKTKQSGGFTRKLQQCANVCVCGGFIQGRWQVFKRLFPSCPCVQNREKNKRRDLQHKRMKTTAGQNWVFCCSSSSLPQLGCWPYFWGLVMRK